MERRKEERQRVGEGPSKGRRREKEEGRVQQVR